VNPKSIFDFQRLSSFKLFYLNDQEASSELLEWYQSSKYLCRVLDRGGHLSSCLLWALYHPSIFVEYSWRRRIQWINLGLASFLAKRYLMAAWSV
jgi:hypothetical protein